MEPIQLFQLASKQAQWLSVRESVVSTNVANANTPAFKTKDIVPFADYLDTTTDKTSALSMISTNPAHFNDTTQFNDSIREVEDKSSVGTSSGNNVSLAKEMMKANEVRQQYDLNTNLVKSLNRMMLMVVKK